MGNNVTEKSMNLFSLFLFAREKNHVCSLLNALKDRLYEPTPSVGGERDTHIHRGVKIRVPLREW